jgi:hypothetical protein
MKIESYKCDINDYKGEAPSEDHKKQSYQVIFVTEQTEGRPTNPYLAVTHIDLCRFCKARVLAGEPIWAAGAQGHNTYYFKPNNK